MTMPTRRHLLGLALAAALAACSTTPPPAAAPQRPQLIVLVAIDGLPIRQVTGYRDQLAPDGFARFLDRGRWFSDAHYAHGHTVTAAGHAVMLSGAYPQRSGIISNEWRDPATGAQVYNTGERVRSTSPSVSTLRLRGLVPDSGFVGLSR